MNVNELVLKALGDLGIPVQYGWYDENINNTHITFFQFLEKPESYEDDEETEEGHYIQVDIWSRENAEILKKQVRTALKKIDFSFLDGQDLFEPDTSIYHKAMRFYVSEYMQ